ncbi:MAG: HPr(Ser) kinase/phosphatase [Ignavibacteria bacterium]
MSITLNQAKPFIRKHISVSFFYQQCKDRFKLKILSDKPIPEHRLITDKDIHRPGLALAGYVDLFSNERIQIFGNTEIKYLNSLSAKNRQESLDKYFSFEIPCIIITNANKPPTGLLQRAKQKLVPVFQTKYPTTRFVNLISDFLDDQFAEQISVHGSFVDVYGVGVLFVGESGIGKSEVALDLVERGHRLVADDIVLISKKAEAILIGSGTELNKNFMEIRGLGIVNIKQIFGIRSVRYQKRVEVVIELELWDPKKNYERVGIRPKTTNLMGVEIEKVLLPIVPGKNITVIAEIIALNYLCRHYGYNAAMDFARRQREQMNLNKKIKYKDTGAPALRRSTEYFEHDFE